MPETKGDLKIGPTKVEITSIEQSLNDAPVIFVEGAQGIAVTGQVTKINFFQNRLLSVFGDENEDIVERTVCLRLEMLNSTLLSVYDWLTPVVEAMRKSAVESGGEGGGPQQPE